jgi:hypothetical protein
MLCLVYRRKLEERTKKKSEKKERIKYGVLLLLERN